MDVMHTTQPCICPNINSQKPAFVRDLDDLIKQIHEAFHGDSVDVDRVSEILDAYKSSSADWKKYAKFDRYKYTRNLVDEGNGKFNVMLLCWGPSQVSSIHDHTDSHCFMKILSGTLAEERFEWPKQQGDQVLEGDEETEGMTKVGGCQLETNSVCYINDKMGLHRVSNPSDSEGAVSLHVYCPAFSSCQMFDERTGKRSKCCVTFYSKFGAKIKYCCKN